MSKFKPGDIVRCLEDSPYGARIFKGELAVVISVRGSCDLIYDNYPKQGFYWAGGDWGFEPDILVEENE